MYLPSYESLHPSNVQNDSEGLRILRDPQTNRGLAFDAASRASLGIRGMLPPCASIADLELERVRFQFDRTVRPLHKYSFLMALQVSLMSYA